VRKIEISKLVVAIKLQPQLMPAKGDAIELSFVAALGSPEAPPPRTSFPSRVPNDELPNIIGPKLLGQSIEFRTGYGHTPLPCKDWKRKGIE
jgi:hypothetical protein